MLYVITGYYLEQLLDLPEGSAIELAYLHALVKFNSFSVKARIHETNETIDTGTIQLDDFTIGSALYLMGSMFNHSCAPNAMVVFGKDGKNKNPDPRLINVVTTRALKMDPVYPVHVDISYGPQAGRMGTKERKEILRQGYHFECNCSACNDKYVIE
jgi:hypothetical protein